MKSNEFSKIQKIIGKQKIDMGILANKDNLIHKMKVESLRKDKKLVKGLCVSNLR